MSEDKIIVIEHIDPPYVYTNTGLRLTLGEIQGTARVGVIIVKDGGIYKIVGAGSDSECVNGVCPIK